MSGHGTACERERLERAYRRVLAWYPRRFRADSEDEVLAVLLATAAQGQTRVGWAEAWDLVRGAVRMRLWPAAARPRAVRAAVKLMLAGAAAELAAVITVVVTAGAVRAAVAAHDSALVPVVTAHLIAEMALLPVAVGMWLWLAWANGRGEDWARLLSVSSFGLTTMGLVSTLAEGAAPFGRADLIACAAVWAIGLASVVLIFTPAAGRYYRPALQPTRQ
jgi:hypothetical protein